MALSWSPSTFADARARADVKPADRVAAMMTARILPAHHLITFIYPRLFNLLTLPPEVIALPIAVFMFNLLLLLLLFLFLPMYRSSELSAAAAAAVAGESLQRTLPAECRIRALRWPRHLPLDWPADASRGNLSLSLPL